MGLCVSKSTPVTAELHSFPYRHAVITGASAGIGAAVAMQLAAIPGMRLTLIARNPTRLAVVQAACRAQGAQVDVFSLDVADKAAMTDALTQAHARCAVDLVVANAGIVAAALPSSSACKVDSLADMLWAAGSTNIQGTLNTLAPGLKLLKATATTGRPAAVAIVSSVSVLPDGAVQFTGQLQMGLLPYAWSKQALLSLGQGLEGELAGSGVAVFTICPGVVLTELATSLTQSFRGAAAGASAAAAAAAGGGAGAGSSIYAADTGAGKAAPGAAGKAADNAAEDASIHSAVDQGPDTPPASVTIVTAARQNTEAVPATAAADAAATGRPSSGLTAAAATPGSGLKHSSVAAAPVSGGDVVKGLSAEEELRTRLNAITAEEAAVHICNGLASSKGGVIAFPAAAVKTMKVILLLPDKFLVKAIKRSMAQRKAN